MDLPADLRYSKSHEWVRVVEDDATIGITDHAQEQLGDITFIQCPEAGEDVEREGLFGAIESVKTRSDLYSPISGKVIEVNEALNEAPELVNEDPYGDGWIVKVAMTNPEELAELMSAEQYRKFVDEEKTKGEG